MQDFNSIETLIAFAPKLVSCAI